MRSISTTSIATTTSKPVDDVSGSKLAQESAWASITSVISDFFAAAQETLDAYGGFDPLEDTAVFTIASDKSDKTNTTLAELTAENLAEHQKVYPPGKFDDEASEDGTVVDGPSTTRTAESSLKEEPKKTTRMGMLRGKFNNFFVGITKIKAPTRIVGSRKYGLKFKFDEPAISKRSSIVSGILRKKSCARVHLINPKEL